MERIMNGWSWMRWLRLGMGVYALVVAVMQQEWVLGLAGIFLAGMALFNIGCCAGGVCAPLPGKRAKEDSNAPISFEEIK